jgi:hypothetical protein
MKNADRDSLEWIQGRLAKLVEARLSGLSPAEAREYRELVDREAELLKQRDGGTRVPR